MKERSPMSRSTSPQHSEDSKEDLLVPIGRSFSSSSSTSSPTISRISDGVSSCTVALFECFPLMEVRSFTIS